MRLRGVEPPRACSAHKALNLVARGPCWMLPGFLEPFQVRSVRSLSLNWGRVGGLAQLALGQGWRCSFSHGGVSGVWPRSRLRDSRRPLPPLGQGPSREARSYWGSDGGRQVHPTSSHLGDWGFRHCGRPGRMWRQCSDLDAADNRTGAQSQDRRRPENALPARDHRSGEAVGLQARRVRCRPQAVFRQRRWRLRRDGVRAVLRCGTWASTGARRSDRSLRPRESSRL